MKTTFTLFALVALFLSVANSQSCPAGPYDNTNYFPEVNPIPAVNSGQVFYSTAVTGHGKNGLICAAGYSTVDATPPKRRCDEKGFGTTFNRCLSIPDCTTDSTTSPGWTYPHAAVSRPSVATCNNGWTCTGSLRSTCNNIIFLQVALGTPVCSNGPCTATRNQCAATGNFPQTDSLTTAGPVACPTGFTGTQTWDCLATDWDVNGPNTSNCKADCQADQGFPQTAAGQSASIACPPNQTGSKTRTCTAAGTNWGSIDSTCTVNPGACDGELYDHTNWESATFSAAGNNLISGTCESPRYASVSTPKRPCTIGGWSNKPLFRCLSVYCSQDTAYTAGLAIPIWPKTQAGKSVFTTCVSNGSKASRQCNDDGTWVDGIKGGCPPV